MQTIKLKKLDYIGTITNHPLAFFCRYIFHIIFARSPKSPITHSSDTGNNNFSSLGWKHSDPSYYHGIWVVTK